MQTLTPPSNFSYQVGKAVLYIPACEWRRRVPAAITDEGNFRSARIRKHGKESRVSQYRLVYRGYCPQCHRPANDRDGHLVCPNCGQPAIDSPPLMIWRSSGIRSGWPVPR